MGFSLFLLVLSISYSAFAQSNIPCSSISYTIGNTNTLTYSSNLPSVIPIGNIEINGILIVNETSRFSSLNSRDFIMKPGSKIILNSGGVFKAFKCKFFDCENYLWNGFEINGGQLVLNQCYVRDALYGVKTKTTGWATLYKTTFRANCYGIYMENNTNSVAISGCRFAGGTTKQAPLGMTKPSYNGNFYLKSYCGIYASNKNWTINNFVINNTSSPFPQPPYPNVSFTCTYFDSLNNGIVYRNCNVTLQRCIYTYIYAENGSFNPVAGKGVFGSANGQLYSFSDIGYYYIFNTHNYVNEGYYFSNVLNVSIKNQNMTNVNRGIYCEGGLNIDIFSSKISANNAITMNYQLGTVKVHGNIIDNNIDRLFYFSNPNNLGTNSVPYIVNSEMIFRDVFSLSPYSANTQIYDNVFDIYYPSSNFIGGSIDGISCQSLTNSTSGFVITNNDFEIHDNILQTTINPAAQSIAINISNSQGLAIRQNTIYGTAGYSSLNKVGISLGNGCTYDSINCNHLNNLWKGISNGGSSIFAQVFYSGNHFESADYGLFFSNGSYSTSGTGLYIAENQIRRDNTWNNTPGAFTQAAAFFYNNPSSPTSSNYLTGLFNCNPNSAAPNGNVFYPTSLGLNMVQPSTNWFSQLTINQQEFVCTNSDPDHPNFSSLQYKIARNEIETEVYQAQFRYNNLSLLYQVLDTTGVLDSCMQALKDSLENTNLNYVNTITKLIRLAHTYTEDECLMIYLQDSVLQSLLDQKSVHYQNYFDAFNLPVYDTLLTVEINDSIMNVSLVNNVPDSILMYNWQFTADSLDSLIAYEFSNTESLMADIHDSHYQYNTWANELLELFEPENKMEENFRDVAHIWLNTLGELNYEFSLSQLNKLNNIAWQCPVSGGHAVQIARDMLLLKFPDIIYPDSLICDSVGISLREQGGNKNQKIQARPDKIIIYPNPASEVLNIVNSTPNEISLKIFNLEGIELISKNRISNFYNHQIDILDLSPGMYILQIFQSGEIVFNKEFVKL